MLSFAPALTVMSALGWTASSPWRSLQRSASIVSSATATDMTKSWKCEGKECPVWLLDGVVALRENNPEVLPLLRDLRSRRFFRYYQADLLAGCTYIPTSEEPCELDACEVEPCDDVPDEIVARDAKEYDFELDGWARWDMPSDFADYYDLETVPEGNTGYDGSAIWRFIHSKVCFQRNVGLPGSEWKADFNRLVSGAHSSVHCHILEDMLNSEPEEKVVAEYRRRLRDEPDALVNLHFALMIVLCGLRAARERLDGCSYLGEADEGLLEIMKKVTASPLLEHSDVTAAADNLIEHANAAGGETYKLRLRTRDLLGTMNCVQCNVCRLHGKVTFLGLSAALNVLLGFSGRGEECSRPPDPTALYRVEVAAMVTTCAKLSAACDLIERLDALDAAAGEE